MVAVCGILDYNICLMNDYTTGSPLNKYNVHTVHLSTLIIYTDGYLIAELF